MVNTNGTPLMVFLIVVRMKLLVILVLFVAVHSLRLSTRAPHVDLSGVF